MIDQRHVDLIALVGRSVQLHRDGRRMRGRCPLHHGKSDTSLVLFEGTAGWRWQCWAGCNDGRSGDAIAWLMTVEGLDFRAACDALSLSLPERPAGPPPPPIPPDDAMSPPELWQLAARQLADEAAARLWTPEGARALDWLRRRGFEDATIRSAGIGYHAADTRAPRPDFGLPVEEGRRNLWVPRGITIPWVIGGLLWKLWVRTPQHAAPWKDDEGNPVHWPKYHQLPGGGNAPLGIDAVQPGKPVMLLEGTLDALAVRQEAGDLVTPIVTGTTGARRVRWVCRLALAPLALLSYDADPGGDAPTRYWAGVLPRTRVWRAYYDDPAAMLRRPGSVRSWVQAGLTH